MITKLHIDALVASKTELYSSNEHFKLLNLSKMELAIKDELESLSELANPDICLERCAHFNLKGTVPEDYRERIIHLDDKLFFLAGIRFRGLDITKPFVSINGNFKEINDVLVSQIEEKVKTEFKIFQPLSFHFTLPQGIAISARAFKIDRYTLVGGIKEIVELELSSIPGAVELLPLNEMNFYDDYVKEYNLLYKNSPQLRSEVRTEDLEPLNDSAKEGLLFEIKINGKRAGVIAGYIENYFGQKEICILEELLFEAYRGKGLGVYIQKAFARKMLDRFEILWGHISCLNLPSLKTAIRNGRKITEIEYCFKINKK